MRNIKWKQQYAREHNSHYAEPVMAVAKTALSLSKVALIIVGDMAEGMFKSFHPHPYYHAFCEHRRRSFKSTINRLEREGYIKEVMRNGVRGLYVTHKGKIRRDAALRDMFLKVGQREKWDGKWRIIIFDVPEKYRKRRDFLRTELCAYGFMQLQKSVWVTPYKIADNFTDVIESMGVRKYVNFAVADTWYNERELLKKFTIRR